MAKFRSSYICQYCGHESLRWQGKCPGCGEWNSLVETVVSTSAQNSKGKSQSSNAKPQSLRSIKLSKSSRISTKLPELDRVLGGGLVDGQVVLLAGEPGIGKSTLLLQVADKLASPKASFLYVSGEESLGQIKLRSIRMGIKSSGIELMECSDTDEIVNTISTFNDRVFKGVVVDSIQTISTSDLSGMAGSVGQVRESAFRLIKAAKKAGVPLFIVGHVTKEGTIAGPSVLAHLVDTVLWFEGDKNLLIRIIHSHKNRFGPTDEVGIFKMEERGLASVENPQKMFLSGDNATSGTALASIMHGTRPILIEIQTLIMPTKSAYPKRIAQGYDPKRLEILVAILSKKCGVALYDSDVFLNVPGGFSIREPGADFAACMSMVSSYFDKSLPKGLVAIGEVGLTGEIRDVVGQDRRIKDARRLGFKHTISSRDFTNLNKAIKVLLK